MATYARPFTDNKRIGMMSPSLVPEEYKQLHKTLWELRNKAIAHTDMSGRLEGHGKMIEVRFVFDGRSIVNFKLSTCYRAGSLTRNQRSFDNSCKQGETES